jgi:hypothetical protein
LEVSAKNDGFCGEGKARSPATANIFLSFGHKVTNFLPPRFSAQTGLLPAEGAFLNQKLKIVNHKLESPAGKNLHIRPQIRPVFSCQFDR